MGADSSGFQTQLAHRLTQSSRFAFPRLRFGQGLAHLDQHPRVTAHLRGDLLPQVMEENFQDQCYRKGEDLDGRPIYGLKSVSSK